MAQLSGDGPDPQGAHVLNRLSALNIRGWAMPVLLESHYVISKQDDHSWDSEARHT